MVDHGGTGHGRAGRHGRLIGVAVLLVLAPISAELLQAYLGDLGGVGGLVFLVVFLAPLYGGAALLIREVAVRTGRGWPGRLLLAAAFGVAMPTLVDGSLFTPERSDIDGWGTLVATASWAGIGWWVALSWVVGHVVMSVAAPLVVAESLARRPGPWLGPIGLVVAVLGILTLAVTLHVDHWSDGAVHTTPTRYAVSIAVIATLVALALSPIGRPRPTSAGTRTAPRAHRCFVVGLVGVLALDLTPPSVVGLVVVVGLLLVVGLVIGRWGALPGWSQRHVGALAVGALLARTCIGFLAPLPTETTWTEKIAQNVTWLALVLVLAVLVERRTRTAAEAVPAG